MSLPYSIERFLERVSFGEYCTIYLKHTESQVLIEEYARIDDYRGVHEEYLSKVVGVVEHIGGSWDDIGVAVRRNDKERAIIWFTLIKEVI